jgi:glycosyltransferase involved in cell wall biosynthesis
VVPTLGRPSLRVLLAALPDEPDWEVIVVDDRRDQTSPLTLPATLSGYPKVISGGAAGPAAARNLGWRAARAPWVVFLDDDVRPEPDWAARLAADLAVSDDVGGVQGRLCVPLPQHRRPTDWERSTSGLVDGWWITADMAYRQAALAAVGGFDERFPQAFREDSEIAYRVTRAGWRLVRGERRVVHPVRPEGRWISVRVQRGNADDALLHRLYGARWRERLGVPRGRRRLHAATTTAGCLALVCAVASRSAAATAVPRLRQVALAAAAGWLGLTTQFAAARIKPGPRARSELVTMVLTSAVIPPLATGQWLWGWVRWRGVRPIPPFRS